MTGIEDVAKTWLVDPAWQKVFKHTVDVMEDYVSYILVRYNICCRQVVWQIRILGINIFLFHISINLFCYLTHFHKE